MAKVLLACRALLLLPLSTGAGVCDEVALSQLRVAVHSAVVPETPRKEYDGKAIAARIREEMMAAIGQIDKDKINALIGQKAVGLNDMASSGGSASVSLAGSEQAMQVDSSYGVIVSRESASVEEGSSINFQFDHGCNTTDSFGSNYCLLPANDKVRMRMSYRLKEPVTKGATMNLNFSTRLYGFSSIIAQHIRGWKNDRFVQDLEDVNTTCPLCGGTCELHFMGQNLSTVMPDCPISAERETVVFEQEFQVPPVNGLKFLRSKYVGSLSIKRADGSVIANATGKFRIGERDMAPCPFILQYINKCKN